MGIFSTPSPFDSSVDKATDENNTGENWAVIMDICDRVLASSTGPKDCMKSIVNRLNHSVPNVIMQSLTLLDACVSNCGKSFHLEVASRGFENELKRLIEKAHPRVVEKVATLVKKWSEAEFKDDPQLSLIPSFYQKMRRDMKERGLDFPGEEKSKPATPALTLDKHPVAVSTQKEEEDIAKAIELSLKETKSSPRTTSLYPSTSSSPPPVKEPRKVRALYDFEAAEDNELTFYTGEIVHVLEDSDPNWWKGRNQRGEGLFPANFVTADLTIDTGNKEGREGKRVSFSEEVEVVEDSLEEGSRDGASAKEVTEIEDEKIEKVLSMLHEADPTGERTDDPQLPQMEEESYAMGPLIDQELEHIDRKHAVLSKLNSELMDSLNLYHNLMRAPIPTYSARTVSGTGVTPMFSTSGPSQYASFPMPQPNPQPLFQHPTPSFYLESGAQPHPGIPYPVMNNPGMTMPHSSVSSAPGVIPHPHVMPAPHFVPQMMPPVQPPMPHASH